ncbi:hypothetical protein F6X59_10495 [Pseudomonas sp. MN1F]|nr:hypothetical protein [Pseudomonas sp. MN1F]
MFLCGSKLSDMTMERSIGAAKLYDKMPNIADIAKYKLINSNIASIMPTTQLTALYRAEKNRAKKIFIG